jgi:hypothetical protein
MRQNTKILGNKSCVQVKFAGRTKVEFHEQSAVLGLALCRQRRGI